MRKTKDDRERYIEAYDKYSLLYDDPVKIMFEIMSDKDAVDPGVRRAAASDLLSFRFPKTKAIDLQLNAEGQAGFHFAMIPFGASAQIVPPGGMAAKDEFTRVTQKADTRIPTLINTEDYEVHET